MSKRIINRRYAGILLEYFLVKDPELPFQYAYGIRYSEQYGIHYIRTTPVTRINHKKNKLFTLTCIYTVQHYNPDTGFNEMIEALFSYVDMPIWDDELIIATMSLTSH